MDYYSIGKFAKLVGLNKETLRNWHKNGTLIPHHIMKNGYRYYSEEQIDEVLSLKKGKIIAYHRNVGISKDELNQQVNALEKYMKEKKYCFELLVDEEGNSEKFKLLSELIGTSSLEKLVLLNENVLSDLTWDMLRVFEEQKKFKIELVN